MKQRVTRWRDPNKPKRGNPEDDLQASIADYLTTVLRPPAWFTAVPAGGGGEAHGKRKKRIGYKAGTPDLEILCDGRAYFMEVKVGKRGLSEAQEYTVPKVIAAGCPVTIVRSIDDVGIALNAWGIPTREHKPDHVMQGLAAALAAQAQSPEREAS